MQSPYSTENKLKDELTSYVDRRILANPLA